MGEQGVSCGGVCRECLGCSDQGCQWDDSPETHDSRGMGAWLMIVIVFPASAILSWKQIGFDNGCPNDFWSYMFIGWGTLNCLFLLWLLLWRKRVQALIAIRHSTTILSFVAVFYLGALACTLTLSEDPIWCGEKLGWGLAIFLGIAAGVGLVFILIRSVVKRWTTARSAVQQRQQQQQQAEEEAQSMPEGLPMEQRNAQPPAKSEPQSV